MNVTAHWLQTVMLLWRPIEHKAHNTIYYNPLSTSYQSLYHSDKKREGAYVYVGPRSGGAHEYPREVEVREAGGDEVGDRHILLQGLADHRVT